MTRKQGRLPRAQDMLVLPEVLRMRSPRMMVVPAAALTLLLTGCDADTNGQPVTAEQAQYAAICVDPRNPNDPNDDVRLDDDACGDDDDDGRAHNSGGFSFVWIDLGDSRNHSRSIPPRGGPVPYGYGSPTHPRGSVVMKQLPPAGVSKISEVKTLPNTRVGRGGFGVPQGGSKSVGGGSKGSSGG